MSLIVQLTNVSVANTDAYVMVNAGDQFIVGENATISSVGVSPRAGVLMSAIGQVVNVLGTVIGGTGVLPNAAMAVIGIASTGYVYGSNDGIFFGSSGALLVSNHGELSGGIHGIRISSNNGNLTLNNTGSIWGGSFGIISSSSAVIQNDGRIAGDTIAIQASEFADFIENRGTIVGMVNLNGGNDFFDGNGGRVVGATVNGGNGDDTIAGGSGVDRITGGAGDDVLDGGDGIDTLSVEANTNGTLVNLASGLVQGFSSGLDLVENFERVQGTGFNDTIIGATGAETLSGGYGNDQIAGGDGNDRLWGGEENDAVNGGNGDDKLIGSSGNDNLAGGAGNDLLIGGSDLDRLFGGAGSDVFLFRAMTDFSSLGVFAAEKLSDFTQGSDLIDLSSIDADTTQGFDQAFVFVGPGAITGSGQISVSNNGSASTVTVCTDFGANPAGVVILTVSGTAILGASDFVL